MDRTEFINEYHTIIQVSVHHCRIKVRHLGHIKDYLTVVVLDVYEQTDPLLYLHHRQHLCVHTALLDH